MSTNQLMKTEICYLSLDLLNFMLKELHKKFFNGYFPHEVYINF